MQILIVDNHDSFVYNIVELLRQLPSVEPHVMLNDAPELRAIAPGRYDAMVLSPGPDLPEAAGGLMELIERHRSHTPMLGICLGHQALAQHFGAQLVNLDHPLHGHASTLQRVDRSDALYRSIDGPIVVGHYHSWAVDAATLPDCLRPTAFSPEGLLMSMSHSQLPIYGVQYHPESIITSHGRAIVENFLAAAVCRKSGTLTQ
jgi:anthranilate synthase component 2